MIAAPRYTKYSVIGYNDEGKLQEFVSDTECFESVEENNSTDEE